jgi:AcrR family transcriptional regulator
LSPSGTADRPPSAAAARRGRPRNAAVDTTVVETVLRLMVEGAAFGDLTMEGIAREAGVGKATVYRRWAGKDALLLDVLAELDGPPELEFSGDLRDDLITVVDFIRRRSLAKRESALLRTMVAQARSSPELWRGYHDTVVAPRRRLLIELLERGVASGEIRPRPGADLELLADMVSGPVLARATLRPDGQLSADLAERIVDTLLEGLRPRD